MNERERFERMHRKQKRDRFLLAVKITNDIFRFHALEIYDEKICFKEKKNAIVKFT